MSTPLLGRDLRRASRARRRSSAPVRAAGRGACACPIARAIRCASSSPKPGREPGPHLGRADSTFRGSTLPVCATASFVQSSSKLSVKARASALRAHDRDHVLLARERVVRPVQRPRPDGLAVADDVLVVHQVGDAGDRARLDAERRDQPRVRLGRRRHGHRDGAVDVVDDADGDAARDGVRERRGHDRRRRRRRGGSRTARGRASAARRAMNSAIQPATASAVWPPSVRVRTSMSDIVIETRRGADRRDLQLLSRRRRAPTPGARRLRRYLAARAGARVLLVGEAAGLPRRARLRPAVHLRAPADGARAGRGDRDDRPPRACASSAPTRTCCSGTPSRRTRTGAGEPRRTGRRRAARSRPARRFVAELARGRRVVPVGRVAERALGLPGIRHPSHGGAQAFREGLVEVLR